MGTSQHSHTTVSWRLREGGKNSFAVKPKPGIKPTIHHHAPNTKQMKNQKCRDNGSQTMPERNFVIVDEIACWHEPDVLLNSPKSEIEISRNLPSPQ